MTLVQIDKPENANLADWFAELFTASDPAAANPGRFCA